MESADGRTGGAPNGGLRGLRDRLLRVFDEPVRGGASLLHVFFVAALVLLIVEALTGLVLSAVYVPHPTSAWASTFYIQEVVPGGWFVRGVHMAAGHAMLVVLGLHLLLMVAVGGYRAEHRAQWWVALAVVGVLFGALITGHRLAWDQNDYWALQVELNLAGGVPVLGDPVRRLVAGGTRIGRLTLTRLYTLHVLLVPVVLWGLFAAWRSLRRADGPPRPAGATSEEQEPYFPRQALMDAGAAVALLVGIAVFVGVSGGAELGGPAEPDRNFPARPEWFLMPLYELRSLAPPALETVVVAVLPLVVVGLLGAVPLLGRAGTGWRTRLPAMAAFLAVLLPAGALLAVARLSPVDEERAEALEDAAERADRAFVLARRGVPPGGPLEMLANDPQTRGKDVYVQYCTSCHVLGEWGDRDAPDHTGFASEAWILALLHDPDAPHFFGETPIDEMPSQSDKGEEALRGAAAFLHSLGIDSDDEDAPRPDPTLVSQGKELWENKCMTCHLFEGDGDFLGLGGPDLTGYGSQEWIVRQTADPEAHYGELNEMPAFGDQLSEHDIEMVAAFLRLQRTEKPVFPAEPPEPGKGDADPEEDDAEGSGSSAAVPAPTRPRG